MTPANINSASASFNPHSDLIEACRKGNQKAQFQIYKLYYKAMYNTSFRIINDRMEAEDIMQESFLAAFEAMDSFSGAVSFGAWLKRIVENRSFDALRKKRKISLEDIGSLPEMEESCPDRSFQNEEPDYRLSGLAEALRRLSKGCRNIFSLYFLEGYDHEEISEILSISESTSRSQLSRARLKIATELNKKG